MDKYGKAALEFAQWLKANHPTIYRGALRRASDGTLGNAKGGGIFSGDFWKKFGTAAVGLGTTYLTLKAQRDAMKINLERAKQGQPPIDTAAVAPVVRTQVQVEPEVVREITQSATAVAREGIDKTLLIGGAVAVGALLLLANR